MNGCKIVGLGLLGAVLAGCQSAKMSEEPQAVVVGYGEDLFTVGELLYETDFSDHAENWVLQISENPKSDVPAEVKFEDGMMDLYMPALGCTAWLKKKFEGPIAITYQVKCPTERIDNDLIMARDINNFWHASDPRDFDAVLTETATHYTGDFLTYHEMNAYYASTGGGAHIGNKTTRFRRYPRWENGKDIPHLSLNDQDENPEHLIHPGEWHTVQLVAFDGMAQYIQDGKVIYEIQYGDTVMSESRDTGEPVSTAVKYTREAYPPYTSGYFGFRMVRTHHQYKNLKIYRLDPK